MQVKKYIGTIFLFFLLINGYSQEYKVYDFKSFENILHKKDQQIYVINFWATWCKPCVEEIPAFNQLNEKYKSSNVKIIMVSLDFGKNVQDRIKAFQTRHNIASEIIILDDPDTNSWIDKVNKNWSGAIPATVIYNKSERKFYERSFSFEELEKELLKFL